MGEQGSDLCFVSICVYLFHLCTGRSHSLTAIAEISFCSFHRCLPWLYTIHSTQKIAIASTIRENIIAIKLLTMVKNKGIIRNAHQFALSSYYFIHSRELFVFFHFFLLLFLTPFSSFVFSHRK